MVIVRTIPVSRHAVETTLIHPTHTIVCWKIRIVFFKSRACDTTTAVCLLVDLMLLQFSLEYYGFAIECRFPLCWQLKPESI